MQARQSNPPASTVGVIEGDRRADESIAAQPIDFVRSWRVVPSDGRLGFAESRAEPALLLSLDFGAYSGGKVMASWTGIAAADWLILAGGVMAARALQLRNKLIVIASRPEVP
jgi:hypothetical protein